MSSIWNQVDLSSYFTTIGIVNDGATYTGSDNTGLDGAGPGTGGSTYSGNLMPSTISWQGETFNIGSANTVDIISLNSQSIPLPNITSNVLYFLGLSTSGASGTLTFQVHYTDSATSDFFQDMSDWASYEGFGSEAEVFSMSYRNRADGGHDFNTFWVYGYTFVLDPTRIPASLTLPAILGEDPYPYILAINTAFDDGGSGAVGSGVGPSPATYNIVGLGGATGSSVGIYSSPVFLVTDDEQYILTDSGDYIIVANVDLDSFATHNITGSGGALGNGSGDSQGTYNITGSSGGLGGGVGTIHTHFNARGVGGGLAGGMGNSGLMSGSGNNYHETGSGGCLDNGTGVVHTHYGVHGLGGALGAGTGTISGGQINETGSGGVVIDGIGGLMYTPGAISIQNKSCTNFKIRMYYCQGAYIPVLTRCNQQIIDILANRQCNLRKL